MAGLMATFVKAATTAIVITAIGSLLKFVRLLRLHRRKLADLQIQGLVGSHSPWIENRPLISNGIAGRPRTQFSPR